MTNRNSDYIQTPRTLRRVRRIATGLILGGSILGASAIVLSVPDEPAQAALPVTTPVAAERISAQPSWSQTFEVVPSPSDNAQVKLGDPKIELELPIHAEQGPATSIAFEHSEPDTDFEGRAKAHIDRGELSEALADMRRHIYESEATQDELFVIGILARKTKDLELSETALLQAAVLKPERSEIHTELARLYLDVKDSKAAHDAAKDAIDLDKENPSAWNVYGRIAMQRAEWQQAELALRHALELDPTNPLYHNNAGLLYIYMKRGEDAVDALETAVELYDEEAPHFVFNNLGLAHELAQNLEESREAFEEALLVNPFYSRAKLNLDRIEISLSKAEEAASVQTAQGLAVSDET